MRNVGDGFFCGKLDIKKSGRMTWFFCGKVAWYTINWCWLLLGLYFIIL